MIEKSIIDLRCGFSRHGSHTISVNTTQELVRNANSQGPGLDLWIRTPRALGLSFEDEQVFQLIVMLVQA